jgi:hypothetical protein
MGCSTIAGWPADRIFRAPHRRIFLAVGQPLELDLVDARSAKARTVARSRSVRL